MADIADDASFFKQFDCRKLALIRAAIICAKDEGFSDGKRLRDRDIEDLDNIEASVVIAANAKQCPGLRTLFGVEVAESRL